MKLLLISPSHKFRKKLRAIKIPQLSLHILASLTPEDVEITLEGDTLTIRGERPGPIDNVDYVMRERPYGKFQRTLNINIPVDADKAEAKYEHGLLTLSIPKAEAVKPRTIAVVTK